MYRPNNLLFAQIYTKIDDLKCNRNSLIYLNYLNLLKVNNLCLDGCRHRSDAIYALNVYTFLYKFIYFTNLH